MIPEVSEDLSRTDRRLCFTPGACRFSTLHRILQTQPQSPPGVCTARLLAFHTLQYNQSSTSPTSFNGANMPISELLLTEFDQEMANTRKALERVPR